MSTAIYTDTDAGRLGAQLADDGMVQVWRTDGPMLGLFKLSRFGGELTAATVRGLFAKPAPVEEPAKRMCVGCFEPMPGAHARGCPTGQNGSPNYN